MRTADTETAKKRPSSEETAVARTGFTRWDPEYWRDRVFRATYTRQGSRRETRGWYVKLQVNGRRRTIALKAATVSEAAAEACRWFRLVVTQGWPDQSSVRPTVAIARDALPGSVDHWRSQLVRRKYIHLLRPHQRPEWSVAIQHDGARWNFPLGTDDAELAAGRAAERATSVRQFGWNQGTLAFEREVTLGFFWAHSPFACTYTTLLTVPATMPAPLPPPVAERSTLSVLLVEPDPGVRKALQYWLPRQEQLSWVVHCCSVEELPQREAVVQPALVLINQALAGPARPERDLQQRTLAPAVSYGAYEDSDEMFRSVSGVAAGYLLRRRPASAVLDPITRESAHRELTHSRLHQLVRRYFFDVFTSPASGAGAANHSPLTAREREILALMSNGLQHKEIAGHLGISIHTVQTHARVVFEKLGVHSRTEAVVKFLQL